MARMTSHSDGDALPVYPVITSPSAESTWVRLACPPALGLGLYVLCLGARVRSTPPHRPLPPVHQACLWLGLGLGVANLTTAGASRLVRVRLGLAKLTLTAGA